MSKVIKSVKFLSIYDNEDFQLTDFEYMKKYHNTSRNDLKNRYISVVLNFTDNTDLVTCEERLKLRGTSFKYFYNSMLEFSNIFNVNNCCYINPNIL